MARNRKRAKERRARQPQPIGGARNGDEAPNPIAHASPDVELAEAQLALGRPELASERSEPAHEFEGGEDFDALEDEVEASSGGGSGGRDLESDEDLSRGDGDGREPARLEPSARAPAARVGTGSRLVNFLQGSWRELQRVQWPDRRQVMQATGVVLGFVIVAGVFLGVADFLAGHVMNYILEGHW